MKQKNHPFIQCRLPRCDWTTEHCQCGTSRADHLKGVSHTILIGEHGEITRWTYSGPTLQFVEGFIPHNADEWWTGQGERDFGDGVLRKWKS